ncbi:recombinase family protein [Enterobacter chengduensis]|uniref:recombinase family protein n=1 Tax=Enterobacter chengduensis TaxID=2494701 RepID=UPI00164C7FEF|nr:recombinase family protein [Klebsiella pneumoniae]MBC4936817.1 recombinase family protein [Klebsiella pneumoniae]
MAQKLYSYQRWSSAVQADGTTKARQTKAAEEYAQKNGLEIEEIVDAGVSGFKSANTDESGALGQFLQAVDQGLIASNAVLFVESLDRITRDEIDTALELFLGILRRGITIVTGMDNKVYTREAIKGNPVDLLTSILMFSRAHEESKTKQNRTNGNAVALIDRFLKQGLPVNIKSIGSHPWWIDDSGSMYEAVKPHPVLWACAQLAMDNFMEGVSVFKVTQMLNERFPHYYKGKAWAMANVRKLRLNKAVYGVRELSVGGKSYVLPNYYPALISEGQFLRLQQIRTTTKYIGKVGEGRVVTDEEGNSKVIAERNNINLLAGMKLFRCGHCGGTMMAMRHGDTIRYLCEKGRGYHHDCKTWSLPGILVEHTLMLVTTIAYIELQQKGQGDKADYTQQINAMESTINSYSTKINKATKLAIALDDIDVDELAETIKELNANRDNAIIELEVLQRKQLLANDSTFETIMMDFFTYAQYGVLQDPVHEYRSKLRDVVYSAIGDVRAWKHDRRLFISFQIKGNDEYYNFSAGNTPYEWGCYVGALPFSQQELEIADGEVPDEVLERVRERYAELHAANMMMLHQAKELLSHVGYPELDSRMFWPRK